MYWPMYLCTYVSLACSEWSWNPLATCKAFSTAAFKSLSNSKLFAGPFIYVIGNTSFVVETCIAHDRNGNILISKEREGFGLGEADHETTTAHGIFGSSSLGQTGSNNGKSETVVARFLQKHVFTTTSWIKLLHSTGRPCSKPTECRMWRSGLCVYFIDAWCSREVKSTLTVFTWCWNFEETFFCHHHPVKAVYIHLNTNGRNAVQNNILFLNLFHVDMFIA